MRKIYLVSINWFCQYNEEWDICGSKPIIEDGEWREVTEEEYFDICEYIRGQKSDIYPRYAIIEKETSFDSDFEKWKAHNKELREKEAKKELMREKNENKRKQASMKKKIEAAKALLKKGIE